MSHYLTQHHQMMRLAGLYGVPPFRQDPGPPFPSVAFSVVVAILAATAIFAMLRSFL